MSYLAAFVLNLAAAACYDRVYGDDGRAVGGRVPNARWPAYDIFRRAAETVEP